MLLFFLLLPFFVLLTSSQETLDVATEPWGVRVERVEVKDVRVPEQLMRALIYRYWACLESFGGRLLRAVRVKVCMAFDKHC